MPTGGRSCEDVGDFKLWQSFVLFSHPSDSKEHAGRKCFMRPLSGQAFRVACFGVTENMDCGWGAFGPSKDCCPLWMFVHGVQQ